MSLISLFLVLIVIGIAVWAISAYIPMDPGIKRLIQIVGVVVAVLYCLYAFGIIGSLSDVKVPSLNK